LATHADATIAAVTIIRDIFARMLRLLFAAVVDADAAAMNAARHSVREVQSGCIGDDADSGARVSNVHASCEGSPAHATSVQPSFHEVPLSRAAHSSAPQNQLAKT
jgi:hypothetical protein